MSLLEIIEIKLVSNFLWMTELSRSSGPQFLSWCQPVWTPSANGINRPRPDLFSAHTTSTQIWLIWKELGRLCGMWHSSEEEPERHQKITEPYNVPVCMPMETNVWISLRTQPILCSKGLEEHQGSSKWFSDVLPEPCPLTWGWLFF